MIYFIDADAQFGPAVRTLFDDIARGRLRAVASAVVVAEVLTGPRGLPLDDPRRTTYGDFFRTFPNVQVRAVTYDVAEAAAALRVKYDLETPDAIVAATALTELCVTLYTNDPKLCRIEKEGGITVQLVGEP